MTDTEQFPQDVQPQVTKFDQLASTCLLHLLALLFYLTLLSVGLYHHHFFMHSPLIEFCSRVLGFCASVIAWGPAFVIAGLVLGRFHFAKDVFSLYTNNDFSVAIALLFLTLPFTVFLARRIHRAASSYLRKRIIFSAALILSISALASTIQYMSPLADEYVYMFACFIAATLYVPIFVHQLTYERRRFHHNSPKAFQETSQQFQKVTFGNKEHF